MQIHVNCKFKLVFPERIQNLNSDGFSESSTHSILAKVLRNRWFATSYNYLHISQDLSKENINCELIFHCGCSRRMKVDLQAPLCTMLQKLSKWEVKAWLNWNLIISAPLQFYVKSNFGDFKRSKNVIYSNFRDAELWILVNLGLESCSFLFTTNQNSEPLKLPKTTFLDRLNTQKCHFT